MSGQELYAMYRLEHSKRGCGTDEWEDLEDLDRDVWDALAVILEADKRGMTDE